MSKSAQTNSSEEETVPAQSSGPSEIVISDVSVTEPKNINSTFTTHTVYKVHSTINDENFEINRRFTDFYILHSILIEIPGQILPYFPEKNYVDKLDEQLIDFRKRVFDIYLKEASKIEFQFVKSLLKEFLTKKEGEWEYSAKTFDSIKCRLPKSGGFSVLGKLFQSLPKIKTKGAKKFLTSFPEIESDLASIGNSESVDLQSIGLGEIEATLEVFTSESSDLEGYLINVQVGLSSLSEKLDEISGYQEDRLFDTTANESYATELLVGAKDNEKKLMLTCLKQLKVLLSSKSEFLDRSMRVYEDLQEEISTYLYKFEELKRLRDQFARFEKNILKAQSLVSEYSIEKSKARQSAIKRTKIEGVIKALGEVIDLEKKKKKIFKVIFEKNYKDMITTLTENMEKMLENYRVKILKCYKFFLDLVKKCQAIKVDEKDEEVEMRFPLRKKNVDESGDLGMSDMALD